MNKTVTDTRNSSLDIVEIDNEFYICISHCDALRPFFMSIVSHSDHWMFISSNGGLTAGRRNADFALFPYYTDDKITDMAELTGSKTIVKVIGDDKMQYWEPMSNRQIGQFDIERCLYKSIFGNKVIFEEINNSLGLIFKYRWSTSEKFGFVRDASLQNISGSVCNVEILDGLQNLLPYGVNSDLQNASSNLVDAYKRNEWHPETGLGIFALSAIIVDKAEPSEALKANIVWSLGIEQGTYLLSSRQLDAFRNNEKLIAESDVKGEKGAYFVHTSNRIEANQNMFWRMVADVNKSHSQITETIQTLSEKDGLWKDIDEDISIGTKSLMSLVRASDGMQRTSDRLRDIRHYSNVLFNIMRGGIFDDGYRIEKKDFFNYLSKANKALFEKHRHVLNQLENTFYRDQLMEVITQISDSDLNRLSIEYLPLKFSRRHGDPSRPWNRFSINLKDERDGSKILDYEGNWRDIFQNWEALSYSYPAFIESMIYKFLNASTFDGYNPYRVTKDGFDWETIEPDDPWSYIGYWGDHQIIYLQKFLEILEKFSPGKLKELLSKEDFVYAAVPYRIKTYDDIVKNPKDTIDFDEAWDKSIRKRRDQKGADGALLTDSNELIYHVNFIEKILATVLAKLINFIPEGGIWMNTQRPEWNDANNALVGNGVSMVTLYYLRRMLSFFTHVINSTDIENTQISNEMVELYHSVRNVFEDNKSLLDQKEISDNKRKEIVDALGKAGSDYRMHIYNSGFWGKKRTISKEGLQRFFNLSLKFLEHTIKKGKRSDGLYHTYNLMTYSKGGISLTYLDEMLEGQVAVLSSAYLRPEEALKVMDALKSSALFRPDQYSYLLYPEKELPGFLHKNIIGKEDANSSELIQKLLKDNNTEVIEKSINGNYHFNGNFKNANDLKVALDQLSQNGYEALVKKEGESILEIFEKVFNHKAFTGRSGTFFAYEGLGSIYWHMVSKLLLAIQECCLDGINKRVDTKVTGRMLDHYYEAQAGIGVHKSPELYGAFPTDPYSHTPKHKGAQQPGMTGQVKEDILSRQIELGIIIQDGCLGFNPVLLRKEEFQDEAVKVSFTTVNKSQEAIELLNGQLMFSVCQVPVVYSLSDQERIRVIFTDGTVKEIEGNTMDNRTSREIFSRSGMVKQVKVDVNQEILK